MSEAANVLPFRARRAALTQEAAAALVSQYLALDPAERDSQLVEDTLGNPDCLMALCRSLREDCDTAAPRVATEAKLAYDWIDKCPANVGIFDEPDFFRGELALIAGTATRHVGEFDQAELWLHRSEAAFGMTVNPSASLAAIAYARVSLQYDRGNYDHVNAILPTVQGTFERLGMFREAAKCRFAQAMSYKVTGRREQCLATLQALYDDSRLVSEPALYNLTLVNLGEMLLCEDRVSEASQYLAAGQALLGDGNLTIAGAHLYGVLGEALSREGRADAASTAYRAAIAAYDTLGMPGYVAYFRLALAETLLSTGDHRQAEWEVLAALPAIDHQRLEAEAKTAIALLQQSARAKRMDVGSLGLVRTHLKNAS